MKILTAAAATAVALSSFAVYAAPPMAAPPGRPPFPQMQAPPPLTGTGAPYLKETSKAIATATSMHLKASISVAQQLTKKPPQVKVFNVELAFAPGNKFMAHSSGAPAGEVLLVGNGGTAYIYRPAQKTVLKRSGMPNGQGKMVVMQQLQGILSGGPTNWSYVGIRNAEGRPCDVVTGTFSDGKGATKTESIYLDRGTHLPRKISSLVKQPEKMTTIDVSTPVFEVNSAVPNSLFVFVPPAGVKVVTPPAGIPGQPAPGSRPVAPPMKTH